MGRPIQKRLAIDLHRKARVPFGECGLKEIDAFQKALPEFQIIVYSFSSNNSIVFQGPSKTHKIILYHNENHFDTLVPKRLPSFFGKRHYCEKCKKFFYNIRTHPCLNVCKTCERRSCERSDQFIECEDCHKFCRNQNCHGAHKKQYVRGTRVYPSKCEKTYRCLGCNVIVKTQRKQEHRCGERLCHICKRMVSEDHLCFMQIQKPKPPSEHLLFFDFETDQSSGEHVVNYAVAQDFQGRINIFEGYDALDEFCEFLFHEDRVGITAIAHNSKSFDSFFLLQWLMKNRPTADTKILRSGQKIMQLYVKEYDIRVIDSLNFFQTSLARLPKIFGLDESKFRKGTFPHRFNCRENLDYEGQIPDVEFYSPDEMDSESRSKFLIWHSQMRAANYHFVFRDEIKAYCLQDVNILRESCIKFRSLFLEEMDIDVFRYVTIASFCMAMYRSKFLKPDTIAIVPKNHYRSGSKPYSLISLQWLEFIRYLTGKTIQHAENGGEFCIKDPSTGKKMFVDGFCEDTNEVFEFYGCVTHAHKKCFEGDEYNSLRTNTKNSDIYLATLEREERLRSLGYDVKCIWECDFELLARTKEFKTFLRHFDLVTKLDARDAFFGDRTAGTRL